MMRRRDLLIWLFFYAIYEFKPENTRSNWFQAAALCLFSPGSTKPRYMISAAVPELPISIRNAVILSILGMEWEGQLPPHSSLENLSNYEKLIQNSRTQLQSWTPSNVCIVGKVTYKTS